MGKKTKKTKWRTLEISLPVAGKNYHENSANVLWNEGWRLPSHKYRHGVGGSCDKIVRTSSSTSNITVENHSCKESRAKTLIEEEYTKITTPRQDVLFKKGYLTKRKTSHHSGDENIAAAADNDTTDGVINVCCIQPDCVIASKGEEVFCDSANTETNVGGGLLSQSQMQSQAQLLCATPPPYLDASSAAAAAIYYGGGYEIYDPYTGNVTALVVGTASPSGNSATAAAATCQPILASMSCRPVPLQSVQWFTPIPSSSEWCCGAFTTPTLPSTQQTDAVVDTAASAIDFDHSTAQSPYFGDSTNLNAPLVESSCFAENSVTTPIPTTGDDDDDGSSSLRPLLQQSHSHSQSYAYPDCVFATSVCDVENNSGNIRHDSPEFPILEANQSTATKRKKKIKRRRRFGDTEDDSESGVEDNPNECVASSEYVFAYACDGGAGGGNEKDDNVSGAMATHCERHTLNGRQSAYQHRRKCAATLSRASVNASPFAPRTPPPHAHPELMSRSLRDSESGENQSHHVDFESESMPMAAAAIATASANVGSSVRRTLLVDNDNKSLTNSPFSSSNSDSGISSPANEDCTSMVVQRQDSPNAVTADRSKNLVDRPDNDNDNDNDYAYDYGNGNSWSATVTAGAAGTVNTFNPSAGEEKTPINGNVGVDGGACSNSVQPANGDKHDRRDKLSKKARMTRVAGVAKRYHTKNGDCAGKPEVASASNTGNAGDRRNYCNDDLDDGADVHATATATSRALNDSATAVVGCGQVIHRRHEQPQQSLWQRNTSSVYGEYEGETDWSDVRRKDNDDTADTGSNQTSNASPNCSVDLIDSRSDGQLSQVDENGSFRLRDGFGSEKVKPHWPCTTSPSTTSDSLHQRDENAGVVRNVDVKLNGDVEKNPSVDQYASVGNCSVAYDAAPSTPVPSPDLTAAPTSLSPSHRRREKWDASREFIGLAARALVEEIMQEAELRIRTCTAAAAATTTTKKCDKLRLPLTQAVTDWLNERGGLPAAIRDSDDGSDSSDARATRVLGERAPRSNTRSSLGNPKTWSNCVIC